VNAQIDNGATPKQSDATPMCLPEDHLAVQDAIRAFVQAEIASHAGC
jgi:hypothetical protein